MSAENQQNEVANLKQRIASLLATNTHHADSIAMLNTELQELQLKAIETAEHLQREQVTRVKAEQQLAILKGTAETTQRELDKARAEIVMLQDQADEGLRAVKQLGAARAERDKLRHEYDELRIANAQSAREKSSLLDSNRAISEQNMQLSDENERLKRDYRILEQSCDSWQHRYKEAYKQIETYASIIWPNGKEYGSPYPGTAKITIARSLWPQDAIREGMDASQNIQKAERPEAMSQAAMMSNATLNQSTNPDERIRRCAMFSRDNKVTVILDIEGVNFTIKG